LDLSNPRELSREVLRVFDKVVGVFLKLSERSVHFYKLIAAHRCSVAFEFGDFTPNSNEARVQSKALVSEARTSAFDRWHHSLRRFEVEGDDFEDFCVGAGTAVAAALPGEVAESL
jgi:hypothetical protein